MDESSIGFTDAGKRSYSFVGYYEGNLDGTVDVRITSVDSSGTLYGKVRMSVSYPTGAPEWLPLVH